MRNTSLCINTVLLAILSGIEPVQAQDQALYGISADSDALIRIDSETARGTLVGRLGFDIKANTGADFSTDGTLL